ncbi:MAG: FAD:protein FMN transferase [Acidimicrobiia bacterium]|nr:FAD:protein FMN transferase [Acidimicrobiia bacterium]
MAVAETRFRVMASAAHVIVVDGPPEAGAVARRGLGELEGAWSRFRPDSDVSRLNCSAGDPQIVNEVTVTLVETLEQAWRLSEGLLDPTVLPALLDAGYLASIDDPQVTTRLPDGFRPDGTNITAVVIDRDRHTITFPPGLVIDPGGIGKGLAADLVVAELLHRGAAGALVVIGGDLAAAGSPPRPEGWGVTVEDPFAPGAIIGHWALSAGGVATSSTRSRRLTDHAGVTGHHLIDPRTGSVSDTDLAAVSVVGSCGWQAEAHATAAVLGGSTGLVPYLERHGLHGLGVTNTGQLLGTDRCAGSEPDGPARPMATTR